MRNDLRINLALCAVVVLALTVTQAPGAGAASAPVAVDAAIVLASDVSRSIDDEEFALERRGYGDAIQGQQLLDAISTGPHGAIALAYVEWAGDGEERVVVDWAVIRNQNDAGAFVAIAHPSWSQLTIEDGRSLGAAHAVEVYNHTCAMLTDRGDGFYLLDQLCNEDRRLTAVAGDDAHFHNGDLDAFGGYVMVKSETLEPESLLGALKAGEFYSSQGPRIYDVEVTKNEVRVECSPVHTIALVTSASPALSRVGRGLTQATIEFAEVAKWAWRDPPEVKWFRIVAIDGPRRRAWTNPIWVDALD